MYIDNGLVNYSRSVYFPVKKEDAERGVIRYGISGGSFLVLAYDIEHSGHLQPYGLPSYTEVTYINGTLTSGLYLIYAYLCFSTYFIFFMLSV